MAKTKNPNLKILKNLITGLRNEMIRFKMDANFRRRISLRVIVVSVKESRGIRISLNVMRSTQIFNEILCKNSHLS